MSNQTIGKEIIEQLAWDNLINDSDVGVTVDNCVVPSYQSKNTATWDAYQVSGAKLVNNHLKAHRPTPQSDYDIKKNVDFALSWDYYLMNEDSTVTVKDGVVKLEGAVGYFWMKIQAEEDVYSITGVMDTVNELGIVLTDELPDKFIAKHIEKAIERGSNINVDSVNVTVEDGDVTLPGEVPSWPAIMATENCAWYTSGVKTIDK